MEFLLQAFYEAAVSAFFNLFAGLFEGGFDIFNLFGAS